jgi:tetratricopeptide (TPR) repeat protein
MLLRRGGFHIYPKTFASSKKGMPRMNLADAKLNQLVNPTLSREEDILTRCSLASDFILSGQYEAAQEALGIFWRGTGKRPDVQGLTETTAAEVLLQCGSLSGWLGTTRQVGGAQDSAKDLISEALRLFESHRKQTRIAEAQYEIAICYWRTGAFDEGRVILEEAFERSNDEQKPKILIRSTLVEISAGRYNDALQILDKAEPIFLTSSDVLKGKWHGQKAIALRKLASAEQRADYMDRAIIEFTAAIYHYEQAQHERYCATNLNNLAMLLYKLERFSEAHEHLDRADKILQRLKDSGLLAQVSETRARVLLSEERYPEASGAIHYAIRILERGGEQALLANGLIVQATVQSRLQDARSLSTFNRAIEIAENAGAIGFAGLAALSMIEEHGTRLSETQLYNTYRKADRLLALRQDAEDIARLRKCARIVMKRLFGRTLDDKDFYLPDILLAYEERFVEQALEEEKGSVTRAARKLGLTHQRFIYILEARHRKLLKKRTPPISHRRSIIRKEKS